MPPGSTASPWSASPWPASAAANPAPPESANPAWSYHSGGGSYGAAGPSERQVQPDLYRSARVPAPTAPRAKATKRGRGSGTRLGIAACIIVLIALVAVSYKLLNHSNATNAGTGSAPKPANAVTQTVPPTRPGAVVKAYFAAIDHHRYRLAWRLGGRNIHESYATFRAGFVGTAHDAVRILSQSGNTATARVIARQANGTRKVYQGTYTVAGGAIVNSYVKRVG